jgi:hypothetical protein
MRFLAIFLAIGLMALTAQAQSGIGFYCGGYYPYYGSCYYPTNYFTYFPSESSCSCCSSGYYPYHDHDWVGPTIADVDAEMIRRMASPPQDVPTSAVLLLKNGTRIDAPGFALVGSTVWVLGTEKASKIPISDVDIAATQSENQLRGINIVFPPMR